MKADFPKAMGWSTKDVERLKGWRVKLMIDKARNSSNTNINN